MEDDSPITLSPDSSATGSPFSTRSTAEHLSRPSYRRSLLEDLNATADKPISQDGALPDDFDRFNDNCSEASSSTCETRREDDLPSKVSSTMPDDVMMFDPEGKMVAHDVHHKVNGVEPHNHNGRRHHHPNAGAGVDHLRGAGFSPLYRQELEAQLKAAKAGLEQAHRAVQDKNEEIARLRQQTSCLHRLEAEVEEKVAMEVELSALLKEKVHQSVEVQQRNKILLDTLTRTQEELTGTIQARDKLLRGARGGDVSVDQSPRREVELMDRLKQRDRMIGDLQDTIQVLRKELEVRQHADIDSLERAYQVEIEEKERECARLRRNLEETRVQADTEKMMLQQTLAEQERRLNEQGDARHADIKHLLDTTQREKDSMRHATDEKVGHIQAEYETQVQVLEGRLAETQRKMGHSANDFHQEREQWTADRAELEGQIHALENFIRELQDSLKLRDTQQQQHGTADKAQHEAAVVLLQQERESLRHQVEDLMKADAESRRKHHDELESVTRRAEVESSDLRRQLEEQRHFLRQSRSESEFRPHPESAAQMERMQQVISDLSKMVQDQQGELHKQQQQQARMEMESPTRSSAQLDQHIEALIQQKLDERLEAMPQTSQPTPQQQQTQQSQQPLQRPVSLRDTTPSHSSVIRPRSESTTKRLPTATFQPRMGGASSSYTAGIGRGRARRLTHTTHTHLRAGATRDRTRLGSGPGLGRSHDSFAASARDMVRIATPSPPGRCTPPVGGGPPGSRQPGGALSDRSHYSESSNSTTHPSPGGKMAHRRASATLAAKDGRAAIRPVAVSAVQTAVEDRRPRSRSAPQCVPTTTGVPGVAGPATGTPAVSTLASTGAAAPGSAGLSPVHTTGGSPATGAGGHRPLGAGGVPGPVGTATIRLHATRGSAIGARAPKSVPRYA